MITPINPVLNDVKDREEVRKALLNLAKQLNEQHEADRKNFQALLARFGSELNYTTFDIDGVLQSFGKARQYKDLITAAANLRPGNTPPTYAAFLGGIYAPRFNAGVADEVYGSFELQHDYYEGSDMFFHVHWTPTTTNTGNIVWGVEWTIANNGTVFSSVLTALGTPTAAPGVVAQHVVQNVLLIPGIGLKIGAVFSFRLFRQNGGTDTFTGNAFLHSVGIHYAADTLGSRQVFTKQ